MGHCPPFAETRERSRGRACREHRKSASPIFFPSFPFSIPAAALCRKAALFILCPGRSLSGFSPFRHQHDRYAHRVRELCHARSIPLPNHVKDAHLASRHLLRDPLPDPVSPTSADLEWDTELSSLLLSTSSSSITSASSVDSRHHCHDWIVSEACDEEVKEWGQYLNVGEDDRRASVATAASSAVWSTIAVSHD